MQEGSIVGKCWGYVERNILMSKRMGPQFDFGGTPPGIGGSYTRDEIETKFLLIA